MAAMAKLALSRPIEAHGEQLTELEFREPTGDDILSCGSPFMIAQRSDGSSAQVMDMSATYAYIVALAGIPLSSAKKLHPHDVLLAYGVVAGFFGPAPAVTTQGAKPSSATSNSQGSTAED